MVFVVCMVAVYLVFLVDALAGVGGLSAVEVVDEECGTPPAELVGELLVLGVTGVVFCIVVGIDDAEEARDAGVGLDVGILAIGVVLDMEAANGTGDKLDDKLDAKPDGVADEKRDGELDEADDAVGVVLDIMEVESVDMTGADETGETLVAALEPDAVVDVLWAKVEVAIASPQARTTMELLRRFCMVGRRWWYSKDEESGKRRCAV